MSKAHYLALSGIPGIGGVTARKLLERFGSIATAFAESDAELLTIPRLTGDAVQAMREADLERLEVELESLESAGVSVVTWEDDEYPVNLLETRDSPFLLYVAGDLLTADAQAVAVVGSRDCSPRCTEIALGLSRELADAGVAIVSGLAQGIDTAAHEGALEADGGRTLAVLGCGLRAIHPRENREMAETISHRGAVLTEYAPNVPVRGPQLMSRDRIVSGLSKAVVVVEAQTQSGSMDTAERARKQERLVFAVPGSPGTDALIRSGAIAVDGSNAQMIISRLAEKPQPHAEQPSLFE